MTHEQIVERSIKKQMIFNEQSNLGFEEQHWMTL